MIRFDTKKDYELYNSKIEENYKLQQENKQIKGNWNKLKEYLKNFDIEYLHETMEHNLADTIECILDKMQELEEMD